jgi:hypothetical protein
MKKLQISEQLLNAVVNYLGTRPYQDVFQMIEALQAEVKEQQKPEVPK